MKKIVMATVAALLATIAMSAIQAKIPPKKANNGQYRYLAVVYLNGSNSHSDGDAYQAESSSDAPTPHTPFDDPNWVLVIVGCATCGVIFWQSWETRKAAKASLLSAQALVNAERARIGFDVSEMGRSFQIDGENSGKTSARITYAHGFAVTLAPEESLPSVPGYSGAQDDNSEWIGPGEKFDLLTAPDRCGFVVDLSDIALCERIRDKKAVLWAFGCIRYFDGVSSDQREKRFCFATSVDSALETYLYPAGLTEYRSET